MKFLIENNKPIAYYADDHIFAQREQGWNIVSLDVNDQEREYVMEYCYWDGQYFRLTINDRLFGLIRNRLAEVTRTNFDRQPKTLQRELLESHVAICGTRDLDFIRRDYINRTLSLILLDGFDKVLSAMRYGCYADIREALRQLPLASKLAVRNSTAFSDELKTLLRDNWQAI